MTPTQEQELRIQANHHFNHTRPPLEILPRTGDFYGAAELKDICPNKIIVLEHLASVDNFNIYEYDTPLSLSNLRNILRYLVNRGFAIKSHKALIPGNNNQIIHYKITSLGREIL